MTLLRILTRIKAEPWAITQEYMDTILDIAQRENMNPEAVAQELGRPLDSSYDVEIRDGVAILPVSGPLFRYANLFTALSGASSYQMLARDFKKAVDSPEVHAILLDIDSPGGEANGVSEFADQIFAARGDKPIVAYVGGTGASAAYWIASAADEIVLNDTALVGSIGTVMSVTDTRERDAKAGVARYEIVSSQSPYKRVDPATDAGRARYQALVDSLSDVFIERVARYRGVSAETVLKNYGQGDVRVGQAAVGAGMADRIGSFEGVVADLIDRGREAAGMMTAAARGMTQQVESEGMSYFLTNQPPAAGDDQRQMEATAANFARLCPEQADALRKEGADAKATEMQGQVDAAAGTAEAERDRIKGILGCDEAKGRETLAQHLAFEDDISVDKAKAYLAAAPVASKGKPNDPLAAAMAGEPEPAVGADGDQDDELEQAVARSQKLGESLGIA